MILFEKTFGSLSSEEGCKIVELSTGEFIIAGGTAGGIELIKQSQIPD